MIAKHRVLILLVGKPLQAKYVGPYVVEKHLRDVDYVVKTPDRRKSRLIVHVNLRRKYIARVTDHFDHIALVTGIAQENRDRQFFSVFLVHLEMEHKSQLLSSWFRSRMFFYDKPGRTNVVELAIKSVLGARPVRQTPYVLHTEKQRAVDSEIASLLKQGIIEETDSAWADTILFLSQTGLVDSVSTTKG